MASVNKVIIIGNLGRDPEVRYTTNGTATCTISVATTRSWKNRDSGEREEETEWHRVVLFDRLAENAGEYLAKGRSVYIEGRLKTRKWEDKEGIERYTTEIYAENMQFLGGRDDDGGGRDDSRGRGRGRDDDHGGDRRPPQRDSRTHGERQAERGRAARGDDDRGAERSPPARRPPPSRPAPKSSTGFDDMDDDIPF